MSTELSFIIDPGGDASRPGLNLQVFPSGEDPLGDDGLAISTTRAANNELVPGDFDFRYTFEFDCVLTVENYGKLEALLRLLKRRVNQLGQWEIVLYNLAQPFSENAQSRSRYIVPGTSLISQEDMGSGWFFFEYWVAIQGNLSITSKRRRGGHYEISLAFEEGTFLSQAMEA
jgi:hypothetical protein